MLAMQEVWGCLCMFFLKLLSLIPVWAPSKAFLFNMISFHDRARTATLWETRLNFNYLQIEKKYWDREKNKNKKKSQQQTSNKTERSKKKLTARDRWEKNCNRHIRFSETGPLSLSLLSTLSNGTTWRQHSLATGASFLPRSSRTCTKLELHRGTEEIAEKMLAMVRSWGLPVGPWEPWPGNESRRSICSARPYLSALHQAKLSPWEISLDCDSFLSSALVALSFLLLYMFYSMGLILSPHFWSTRHALDAG